MKLQVGDRVVLSPQGIARWGTSSRQGGGGEGILSHPFLYHDSFCYEVIWDTLESNSYGRGDLILAEPLFSNEVLLRRKGIL